MRVFNDLSFQPSCIASQWLLLRVHFDAFMQHPSQYLTAVKWRLLGKKVRARGQFAPLLSNSKHAYQLWSMYDEHPSSAPCVATDNPILGLVLSGHDTAELNDTLASLQTAGIAAVVIHQGNELSLDKLPPGLDFANTKWIMPIRAGDRISAISSEVYVAAIEKADENCTIIYADDDQLDRYGRRTNPHFKPGWNGELQTHHDIITGACIVKASAEDLWVAAQQRTLDEALVSLAVKRGSVAHTPAMLHHRRWRPAAPTKIEPLKISDKLPAVSVIIPTRNRADLLQACVTGLRITRYPNVEIIIVNNDSDDPETLIYLDRLAKEGATVLDQPGPFNYSSINNKAVAVARGELICLMNNDVEVLSPDWLALMATQAMRPEVGAVGAQLLYPDGRIQHAGVVIGVGNAAGHAHRFLRPEDQGYFRRHVMPQYVSAVTAACLVVRRDRFLAVGGLDEENFPVAFNDVDLCLKLNQHGWQSFYEPRAVLTHHESISRGHDIDPVGAARFARELGALQRVWRTNEIMDPYHHPRLSRAAEQFAIDLTAFWGSAK